MLQLLILVAAFLFLIAGQLYADEDSPRDKMGFLDILMLPRVWVAALFCIAGLLILMKSKSPRGVRDLSLPIIFIVFGVLAALPLGQFAKGMGLHPSPMCTVTKPFLFVNAGRSIPIVFGAILFSIAVFSIAGNKLFCGWVCPIGAIQELVNRIPVPSRYKIKLPFKVTNWIRVVIYVAFIPVLFLVGKDIYGYINPFETLHWGFGVYGLVVLFVVMVVSLFIFRPFCYLACPMGLLTWLLERISLTRIKVDFDKCITCYECVDKAPCPAIGPIVDGHRWAPDCHACGRCLDTCAEDAIQFTSAFKK